MKKILIVLLLIFTLTGCGSSSAKDIVSEYLEKYKNLDSEVLVDMERVINIENLNDSQQDKYRYILKKQYQDMKYEIIEEEYSDNTAYVTVKIEVYDLYKAQADASTYLTKNPEEFYNEFNTYDNSLYIDYKLDKMKYMNNRVEYTLTFIINFQNDEYKIEQPTEDMLEKIHGVYNYELG